MTPTVRNHRVSINWSGLFTVILIIVAILLTIAIGYVDPAGANFQEIYDTPPGSFALLLTYIMNALVAYTLAILGLGALIIAAMLIFGAVVLIFDFEEVDEDD